MTSFLLNSCYFLVMDNFSCLLLNPCPAVLLWPKIPCRRKNLFRQFYCHGNTFVPVAYVFFFDITFIDLSAYLSSASSGSAHSLNFCCFRYSDLQAFAKCLVFLNLWHTDFRLEHLWLGFQFGKSQNLQFRSFGLSLGLAPYLPECVILCIGSSLGFSFGLI